MRTRLRLRVNGGWTVRVSVSVSEGQDEYACDGGVADVGQTLASHR